MLIFGDHNCIPNTNKAMLIYNLSSMKEGFERVNILPPSNISYNEEKGFDMNYASYLMSDEAFFEFFGKVIMPIYDGYDVYIVVTRNGMFDAIEESLQKFIQQRYGINSYIVNSIDDYIMEDITSFSIQGLYNLDIDKDRYIYRYATINIEQITKENNRS